MFAQSQHANTAYNKIDQSLSSDPYGQMQFFVFITKLGTHKAFLAVRSVGKLTKMMFRDSKTLNTELMSAGFGISVC